MLEENEDNTEDKVETLRETLERKMNSFKEEEKSEDAEEATEEEETEAVVEEAEEEIEEVENAEEVAEDEEETEVVEEALAAPEHWAEEDRETFSSQNEEVKTYLLKRHNEMEAGFTKKSQELAEQRKQVESHMAFVNKWEPHTQAMGIPLEHGLEKLLEADRTLRSGTPEQKKFILDQIALDYGISVSETVADEYADPQLKAMQDQINTLNGSIQTREQQEQQRADGLKQQSVVDAQTAIDAFKTETDDKGALVRPHFGTLEADILAIVQSGQAGAGDLKSQLESSYDKALWMNPTTREQLMAQQQSSSKKETIDKQSKAAAQAKKSAKSNKKGTSAKAEKPKTPPNLRDDIAEQLKQARSM